jgi:hypothetical protein
LLLLLHCCRQVLCRTPQQASCRYCDGSGSGASQSPCWQTGLPGTSGWCL